ncbi:MAG: type II toxin-antitoxin system RelE/ParE family toxin [Gammaproteobacteria bacterium]|nr:type II toxin-antitoxin system RelE/ParE family toxin [Gammaproteobacteria bacterium]
MTYDVELLATANFDLGKLDPKNHKRVLNKLSWLAVNLDETRQKALKPPYEGMFRLRCGDYRIIYTCDRKKRMITVHRVQHRRDVYKRKR